VNKTDKTHGKAADKARKKSAEHVSARSSTR
jgi:hypothetical protein